MQCLAPRSVESVVIGVLLDRTLYVVVHPLHEGLGGAGYLLAAFGDLFILFLELGQFLILLVDTGIPQFVKL